MWERQTDGERRIQIVILTHNFSFSWPYYASRTYLELLLGRKQAVGRAVWRCSSGAHSHSWALPWLIVSLLAVSWHSKTKTLTDSVSHVGIFIYNFITPTHFRSTIWLLPLIYTDASCAENLWLTAQTRANMQQKHQANEFLIWEVCIKFGGVRFKFAVNKKLDRCAFKLIVTTQLSYL